MTVYRGSIEGKKLILIIIDAKWHEINKKSDLSILNHERQLYDMKREIEEANFNNYLLIKRNYGYW